LCRADKALGSSVPNRAWCEAKERRNFFAHALRFDSQQSSLGAGWPSEYDEAMSDETPDTPETHEAPPRRRRLRTQRLEAFSDGVFAIAITLLVLDLAIPVGAGQRDLLGAFLAQWPSYLAYVVSFSTIGAIRLGHGLITEYLEQADGILVRLNLVLLLVVSFLPFPTRLLAQYLSSDNPERVAVTIYGLTLLAAVTLLSLLWRYAVRARLVRSDAGDDELIALTSRLTPGLAGYVLLLGLGFFKPVIAVIGYLLIALFVIIPLERVRRSSHRSSHGRRFDSR